MLQVLEKSFQVIIFKELQILNYENHENFNCAMPDNDFFL